MFVAHYFTFTASKNVFCFLSYKSFYKNGLEATYLNSNFGNYFSTYGLYLVNNKGFTYQYYIQAISSSKNPPYSNKINSKTFTIEVKTDPTAAKNPYVNFSKKFDYLSWKTNANVTYLSECTCDIKVTQLTTDPSFSLNFQLDY